MRALLRSRRFGRLLFAASGLLAFPHAAHAMPTFLAADPEDVRLAQEAWTAGLACTGRTPVTAPVVRIERKLPEWAVYRFAGLANWSDKTEAKIRLAERTRPAVIAHEVAHAWVHVGPSGLVEGRTALLTACMQQQNPESFAGLLEARSELEIMPDLRVWKAIGDDPTALGQAYLGAFRLFRAMGLVVPPERLWSEEVTRWDTVERLLAEAGPPGERVLAALAGGAETQRAALVDPDLDGLSILYEQLSGTDPVTWDSDGDGWWDGAPTVHPEGAVPLRRGQIPVCLPMVPASGSLFVVELGGQLGGLDIPAQLVSNGPAGMLVTWLTAWTGHPGGVYARATGDTLVANEQCAMRRHLTMRSTLRLPDGRLGAIADAVEASVVTITAATGLADPFLVVEVDGEAAFLTLTRNGSRVLVPVAMPGRATTDEAREALARAIAALSIVGTVVPHERAGAAAALLRTVWPGAPIPPALGAPAYEIAPWTRAVGKCARGWSGLLDGTCDTPNATGR
jgi:hypothetical protein